MTSLNSAGQHYNLKWTNHTNNILQMFMEHLQKQTLCDVTLACEGKMIKAHKVVLSSCSLYFQDLFTVHAVDNPLIIMNGIRYSTLSLIIDFMYKGEIKVADAELDSLLMISETMQVKGLSKVRKDKCTGKTEMPSSDHPESDTNQPESFINRKKRRLSPTPLTDSSKENVPQPEAAFNGEQDSTSHISTSPSTVVHAAQQGPEAPLTSVPQPAIQPCQDLVAVGQSDRQPMRISRPPNAFMIFANEWRKKLALEHKGENNKEISIRLGNLWKNLSTEAKEIYYSVAKNADDEYRAKYPEEARQAPETSATMVVEKTSLLPYSGGIIGNIDQNSLVQLVMPDMGNPEDMLQAIIKDEPLEDYGMNETTTNINLPSTSAINRA